MITKIKENCHFHSQRRMETTPGRSRNEKWADAEIIKVFIQLVLDVSAITDSYILINPNTWNPDNIHCMIRVFEHFP